MSHMKELEKKRKLLESIEYTKRKAVVKVLHTTHDTRHTHTHTHKEGGLFKAVDKSNLGI